MFSHTLIHYWGKLSSLGRGDSSYIRQHDSSAHQPPLLQLFKGKFYICEGLDTRNITNKSDCSLAGYRWIRRKYNFDNLGQVRRGTRCRKLPLKLS